MSDIATKLTYLNETKSQLKDMINYGLPTENQITNETTFRNYVKGIFEAFLESLRDSTTLYTNLPKISGNGTQITLNDTANAPMRITLKASELTQDATPTPDTPQDIHTISGNNSVVVEGKNLFNGSLYDGLVENTDGTFKSTTQYESSTAVIFKGSPNETYRLQLFYKDGTKPDGSNPAPFYANINNSWKNLSTFANGVVFTTDANGEATIKIGASSWGDIGKEDVYILLTRTNAVNTFADYVPYVEEIAELDLGDNEYCKIGNYEDEFIYNTTDTNLELNKWYLKKNIGKVVLDGSEGWYTNASTFRFSGFNGKPFTTFEEDNPLAYSNYFKWQNGKSNVFVYGSMWYILDGTQFVVQKEATVTQATLADFKTWLSTHNTIVYYVLANPTYTQITGTLETQLNNIYEKMLSYKGTTNISQVNNDLPFVLGVSAIQDLD